MTIVEFMAVVGFAGLFFSAGVAVGRMIERFDIHTKNDRR